MGVYLVWPLESRLKIRGEAITLSTGATTSGVPGLRSACLLLVAVEARSPRSFPDGVSGQKMDWGSSSKWIEACDG
jgi:hypothetical protein